MRLSVLRDTGLVRSKREQFYDDIVLVAAELMGTPMALISLVQADSLWFKARVGTRLRTAARDVSFCSHAILEGDGGLVVEDASRDARFRDNPYVAGEGHVRFYAGMPICVGEHAMPIGTICTVDTEPHPRVAPKRIEALAGLGRIIEDHINRHLAAEASARRHPVATPARA